MLARVWSLAFHAAGLRVKIVPVDCDDQTQAGGLDDCDMRLLRSLDCTPLVEPVTAIFAYQPTYLWPKLPLEQPHVRIMLTTFDSSAAAACPPDRQIFICNQMDQTWLANATEAAAWVRAGLAPQRAKAFNWPHDWIENPRLAPRNRPSLQSIVASDFFTFRASCLAVAWMCCCAPSFASIAMNVPLNFISN